ncbi:VWA domain-containing protein [Streptomyces sp. SID7499]|uniref:VWA domain-containing protein n=1 Tax=Streptomyces sp. SID7499 TaxID=2706086 RepID=A0A6G3WQ13_9ACTN|nr:VWA domain-containing protein [Streptomyces sp. SID7499]
MTRRSLKRPSQSSRSVFVGGDNSGRINTGDTTVEMPRIVRVPLAVLLAAALTVGVGWLYFDWFSPKLAPNYRTQFLIDTAAGTDPQGMTTVATSLGKTVVNSGDEDALALRRFGGRCGATDNTARLVGFDVDNREEITRAAGRMRPAGGPTLVRGIVQAVEDFSEPFDRKARQVNRIIVVTRHGVDACEDDIAFVEKEIRERVGAAGLSLQFRVVGFQVPDDQRRTLDRIATAAEAPQPVYVENASGLDRTLDWFSNAEPVLASAQRIVDTLNTTVDQVNTAIRAVKDGRLDTADGTLGRARKAVNGTRPEFDDLTGRARNPDARNVNEAADRLRRKQKQVVDAASRVLESAEAGSPLDPRMQAFQRAAAAYNDETKAMNKLLAALRGKLTGAS